MTLTANRSAAYKPALFSFCIVCLCWITLLLFAGGFTTTIRAGMAFLDWPLSNGSINPQGWTTESDKLAEHSHRLLGMKIGLLSIALYLWTWLREARASVRGLARLLLLVVILQGVLGGARVRFDWLNTEAATNLWDKASRSFMPVEPWWCSAFSSQSPCCAPGSGSRARPS